jgi:NAD(P)-dependent dehydrogenase (short-subunit alcohol dehydrogenase family)
VLIFEQVYIFSGAKQVSQEVRHLEGDLQQLAVERLRLPPGALSGQVAVVTGGARGIGRETARLLARLGASVVIADIDPEGAETERVVRQEGGQAVFVPTDVADEEAVTQLARGVHEAFGPADILVNNAIICPVAPLQAMSVEQWDRVMAVNLRGPFLTCRTFLPEMLARGRGTVINLVSTDAMPHLSAYLASKQGLAALTQSLALEVADQGVRVVALAPGFVDTPGLREAGAVLAPQLGMSTGEFMGLSLHPAYQGAMPAGDAAAAIAYLAAELAEECHGEVVTGYWVLERAGLLTAELYAPAASPNGHGPTADAPGGLRHQEALALSRQLQEALVETEAEFGRLPFFVRPLARSAFKSKAGQSLPDWGGTATQLVKRLEAGGADPQPDYARLRPQLDALATYYRGVPAETARFTRDAAVLTEVTDRMAGREALIHALIAALGGQSA